MLEALEIKKSLNPVTALEAGMTPRLNIGQLWSGASEFIHWRQGKQV